MASGNGKDRDQGRLAREIEALLFASDEPLALGRLSSIAGGASNKELKTAIESLGNFYREHARSFEIVEIAGGYQITTLPEFSPIVSRLFKSRRQTRLSQPALETLAIIAYKQPISRTDIEVIRGVNCEGVLSTLIERELVVITGRGAGAGRPYLYSTTRKFLEYMGLKDFRDLPGIEEFERIMEAMNLATEPEIEEEEETTGDASPSSGIEATSQE